MVNDLFAQGQAALKAGDKAKARQIFKSIVQKDPRNENAWLWLAGAVDSDFERAMYLEKALAINPMNAKAKQALDRLAVSTPPAISDNPVQPSPLKQAPPLADPSIPAIPILEAVKAPVIIKKSRPRKIKPGKVIVWGVVTVLAILAVVLVGEWIRGGGLASGSNSPEYNSPTVHAAPTVRAAPTTYKVMYEITGSAGSVSITLSNAQGGTEQGDYSLPFRVTISMHKGDFVYISAQNNGETGSVTCKIWVNGVVWKESTSAGAYVIADCSGSIGTK